MPFSLSDLDEATEGLSGQDQPPRQQAGGFTLEDVDFDMEPVAQAKPAAPKRKGPMSDEDIMDVLYKNKNVPFVHRILEVDKFPVLEGKRGTTSTHKMAWGESDGKFVVHPTVFYDEFQDKMYEPEDPWAEAKKKGELLSFDTKEEADEFSKKYKVGFGKGLTRPTVEEPEIPEQKPVSIKRAQEPAMPKPTVAEEAAAVEAPGIKDEFSQFKKYTPEQRQETEQAFDLSFDTPEKAPTPQILLDAVENGMVTPKYALAAFDQKYGFNIPKFLHDADEEKQKAFVNGLANGSISLISLKPFAELAVPGAVLEARGHGKKQSIKGEFPALDPADIQGRIKNGDLAENDAFVAGDDVYVIKNGTPELRGPKDRLVVSEEEFNQDKNNFQSQIESFKRRSLKEGPDKWRYWFEKMPFTGALITASHLAHVKLAKDRIKAGNPEPGDVVAVGQFLADIDRAEKEGWGDKVFDLVASLPGYAIEFGLTGGTYTLGRKVLEKSAGAMVRKAIVENIKNDFAKTLLTKSVGLGTRMVGGGVSQSLANPQQWMSSYYSRKLYHEDEGFGEALAKSFGDVYTNTVTERAGGTLARVPLPAKMQALKTGIMQKWLQTNTGKTYEDFMRHLKRYGWNRPVGEIFEEELANLASAAPGLIKPGMEINQYPYKTLEDFFENLIIQGVAFSVPSLVGLGLGARKIGKQKREIADVLETFDRLGMGEIAPVLVAKERFQAGDYEAAAKILNAPTSEEAADETAPAPAPEMAPGVPAMPPMAEAPVPQTPAEQVQAMQAEVHPETGKPVFNVGEKGVPVSKTLPVTVLDAEGNPVPVVDPKTGEPQTVETALAPAEKAPVDAFLAEMEKEVATAEEAPAEPAVDVESLKLVLDGKEAAITKEARSSLTKAGMLETAPGGELVLTDQALSKLEQSGIPIPPGTLPRVAYLEKLAAAKAKPAEAVAPPAPAPSIAQSRNVTDPSKKLTPAEVHKVLVSAGLKDGKHLGPVVRFFKHLAKAQPKVFGNLKVIVRDFNPTNKDVPGFYNRSTKELVLFRDVLTRMGQEWGATFVMLEESGHFVEDMLSQKETAQLEQAWQEFKQKDKGAAYEKFAAAYKAPWKGALPWAPGQEDSILRSEWFAQQVVKMVRDGAPLGEEVSRLTQLVNAIRRILQQLFTVAMKDEKGKLLYGEIPESDRIRAMMNNFMKPPRAKPVPSGVVHFEKEYTPEEMERLEEEYHQEMIAEGKRAVREENRQGEKKSFRTIMDHIGLPSLGRIRKTGSAFAGEFQSLYENPKLRRMIRAKAPAAPDILRESFGQYGYRFEIIDDMIQALDAWGRSGKEPNWTSPAFTAREEIGLQPFAAPIQPEMFETPKGKPGEAIAKAPPVTMDKLRQQMAGASEQKGVASGAETTAKNTLEMFPEFEKQPELFAAPSRFPSIETPLVGSIAWSRRGRWPDIVVGSKLLEMPFLRVYSVSRGGVRIFETQIRFRGKWTSALYSTDPLEAAIPRPTETGNKFVDDAEARILSQAVAQGATRRDYALQLFQKFGLQNPETRAILERGTGAIEPAAEPKAEPVEKGEPPYEQKLYAAPDQKRDFIAGLPSSEARFDPRSPTRLQGISEDVLDPKETHKAVERNLNWAELLADLEGRKDDARIFGDADSALALLDFQIRIGELLGFQFQLDATGYVKNHVELAGFVDQKLASYNQNVSTNELTEMNNGSEASVFFPPNSDTVYIVMPPSYMGGSGIDVESLEIDGVKTMVKFSPGSRMKLLQRLAHMNDIGGDVSKYITGTDEMGRLLIMAPRLRSNAKIGDAEAWLTDHDAIQISTRMNPQSRVKLIDEAARLQWVVRGQSKAFYLVMDTRPSNFLKDTKGFVYANDLIVHKLTPDELRAIPELKDRPDVQEYIQGQAAGIYYAAPVTPEQDAAYLKAVETGDTAKAAKKFRDIARKKLGVPEKRMAAPLVEGLAKDEREIVNPIPTNISQKAKVEALEALTKENIPILENILHQIDSTLGTKSKFSVKEPQKIIDKANRPQIKAEKPWHDVEHIRDSLRFKTDLNTFADFESVFDIIVANGIKIVKVDTRKMFVPKEWGWRFGGFDLRFPNGQLVKFYSTLVELDQKGTQDVNHDIFEKWRGKNEEYIKDHFKAYQADVEDSYNRYQRAWEAGLKRQGLSESAALASWRIIEQNLASKTGSNLSFSSSGLTTPATPNAQAPSFARLAGVPSSSAAIRQTSPLTGSIATLMQQNILPKVEVVKRQSAAPVAQKVTPEGVEYPLAGATVDGRKVRDDVPNTSSIAASLDNYTVLRGIREVPMSDFSLTGKHYSVEGTRRISELEGQIKQSSEITPLIVVQEADGPYILEGSTRAEALYRLGAKSFPALVVVNDDSPPAAKEAVRYAAPRDAQPQAVTARSMEDAMANLKPEIRDRMDAAKGIKRSNDLLGKLKEAGETAWKAITRYQMEIPNDRFHAKYNEAWRQFVESGKFAQDMAIRKVGNIIEALTPAELDNFRQVLIMRDMLYEVSQGRSWRFGFDKETGPAHLERMEKIAEANPRIAEALAKRSDMEQEIRQQLIDAGILTEEQAANPHYYRHQVIMYADAMRQASPGRKRRYKISIQKGRIRGDVLSNEEYDYNTDYIQAEYEWMTLALQALEKERFLKAVQSYDILPRLKKEARAANMKLLSDKIAKDPTIQARFEGLKGMQVLQELKAVLGNEFKTWEDFIPEGYAQELWQPTPGNVFYRAYSVPEKILEQLQKGLLEGVSLDDLRAVVAMGQARPGWLIPEGMFKELSKQVSKEKNALTEMSAGTMGMWKRWTLFNPRKFIPYMLRNMTGDIDPVIATQPGLLKYAPAAAVELWRHFYSGKLPSADLQEAMRRGVVGTGLTAAEMPDVSNLKLFLKFYGENRKGNFPERLYEAVSKIPRTYFEMVIRFNEFRENLLRYSAYRFFLDHPDVEYTASRMETVSALSDVKDRSAKMARELLGDYGAISVAGQTIRRHFSPFWSWNEVNFSRTNQIVRNAFGLGVGKGMKTAGILGAAMGTRLTIWLLLRMSFLYGGFLIWNRLMRGDDDDKLNRYDRQNPHITFGHDKDGNPVFFRNVGALGDWLEWFGGNSLMPIIQDVQKGQKTWEQAAKELASDPLNKFWSGLSPAIKTPMEISSGMSSFPDVTRPSPITDTPSYLAGTLGLRDEVNWLRGRPQRGLLKGFVRPLLASTDYKMSSWYDLQDLKSRFLETQGQEKGLFFSPNSAPMRDMRASVRMDDQAAFNNAFERYMKQPDHSPASLRKTLSDDKTIMETIKPSLRGKFYRDFLTESDRTKMQAADEYAAETNRKMMEWARDALREGRGR